MYTAAEIIKNTRIDRQYSLEEVSKKTKISQKYLEAIESLDQKNYPAEPYCCLFVSQYAQFLGLEADKITSLFRRDNSQQVRQIKANKKSAIYFTPQFLFTSVTVFIILFMFFFLLSRYLSFNKPPKLTVNWSEKTENGQIRVVGNTDSNCTIRINQDLVIIDQDGSFSKQVDISQDSLITVESTSPSGKKTVETKNFSKI
jgi:cytoskeletal protein RodZ